jgi:hypothetical protein
MALTEFQRSLCRLLAESRVHSGESYVAGGAALNQLVHAPRRSRDIAVFHDTQQAFAVSWRSDRGLLEARGYGVSVVRERPAFVEAEVRRDSDAVIVHWAHASAHRFFPLVRHEELGLVLHPFDLATSKVLALAGRVEPRDFVDTLTCDHEVQPLGFLAWAACGKDPGWSPASILEQAARSARYTEAELEGLDYDGEAPKAAELSQRWQKTLAAAREVTALLPSQQAGRAVMVRDGGLFREEPQALRRALEQDRLVYHEGSIGGAFPRILPTR